MSTETFISDAGGWGSPPVWKPIYRDGRQSIIDQPIVYTQI